MPQVFMFLVIAAQSGALLTGIGAVITTFLPSILGVTVSLAASFLFAPKQPKPEDVQTQTKNPTAARFRHYGRVKISGPWAFAETKSGAFYKVLALGTGELDAFEEYWIDDTPVTVNAGGVVQTAPWTGKCLIQVRKGLPTETPYSDLTGVFPEWDADHRGDGVASCLVAQAAVSSEELSSLYPNITATNYRFVVRGSKVYNVTSGATAWSDNAALVIRDYMTHPDGMRLPESIFTTPLATAGWIAAQARANEAVPLKAGGTEPRYRLWGSYALNERPADVLGRMFASCDARIMPTADGGFTLDIGTWAEPTVTLTEDTIVGIDTLSRGRDIMTTANTISATYLSPNHDYQAIDADQWVNDDDVALRGEVVADTSFNMAPSHGQARRLMKLAAYRSAPSWVGTFQCNLGAMEALGERFIRIDYPLFGINEVVEVTDFRFNIVDGGVLQSASIDFQSMPAAAYSWDAATEEGTEPEGEETDVDRTIDPPADFAAVVAYETVGGVTVAYVNLTFAATPASLRIKVEGREVGATDWTGIAVADGATSAKYGPIDDTKEYEFRAAYVTLTGRVGDYTDPTLAILAYPSLDFQARYNSQYIALLEDI